MRAFFSAFVFVGCILPGAAAAQPRPSSRPPLPLVYLLVAETPIHAQPSPDAPVVARLKALEVILGEERVPGWVLIQGSSATGILPGSWTPLLRENVLVDSFQRIQRRLAKLQYEDWPISVKIEVLRGRIRPGFTPPQVQLALGEPREKLLQRRGDDVYEAWKYYDRLVIFSHTVVESIQVLGGGGLSDLTAGPRSAPQ